MSPHSIDRVLKAIISTGSIPNGLIMYGEECEFLFNFAIDFAKSINCTCRPAGKICDNCSLFSSFQHPDVKFLFPVLHSNPDDCCDNYIEDFKTFFIKKKKHIPWRCGQNFYLSKGNKLTF